MNNGIVNKRLTVGDEIPNGFVRGRLPYNDGDRKSILYKDLKWINNGLEEKMVHCPELQTYLDSGWLLGRLKNKGVNR